ncbi:hypothetical protein WN982_19480 [Paraburkholderia sp. IMGN_8]|uniref:hypothetical protein n=1 Tax=Paraburkholderia sp. IMGN_8 TaxID=3136564 RepID=UPI0031016AD0
MSEFKRRATTSRTALFVFSTIALCAEQFAVALLDLRKESLSLRVCVLNDFGHDQRFCAADKLRRPGCNVLDKGLYDNGQSWI